MKLGRSAKVNREVSDVTFFPKEMFTVKVFRRRARGERRLGGTSRGAGDFWGGGRGREGAVL